MSAETIPADVIELVAKTIHDHWQGAPGLSARPWGGEKGTCAKLPAQAEDFRRKARAVMEALATRPAEPAAPVAEVKAWLLGDPATGQWIEVDGHRVEYSRGIGTPAHVLASAFQAERARADELCQERDQALIQIKANIAAIDRAKEFVRVAEQRAADALARVEELEFGAGFEAAFDAVVRPGSRYENWTPADDPAEIVTDLYNDLEDALARAEKAEDWQPIETAPVGKNGIAFMMLSFGPPGDQTVSEGLHFNGRFYAASVFHKVNPSDGRHFVFREHEVRPTHWRPTLAPPRDLSQGGQHG